MRREWVPFEDWMERIRGVNIWNTNASQLMAADADHDAREHLANMREERSERFTPAEEARADDALLILFKLREQLRARDADALAGQVDDVLRDLEFVVRKGVR